MRFKVDPQKKFSIPLTLPKAPRPTHRHMLNQLKSTDKGSGS